MTQLSEQPRVAGAGVATGRKTRLVTALGPAFVAAIAYLDPGNFATNFAGGSSTGYRLVWVMVLANLVAMPIQYLSAKLGVVTGRSLPQLCHETMTRRARWLMWVQAEVVAMATDLAEFVGAAIGLNLLFGMPLPVAAVVTAVLSFTVLAFQRRGHRPFEVAIGFLLALICAGFLYLTLRIPPSGSGVLTGLVPSIGGSDTLLLAVGIIGATVMPHAIYLHSGLMSKRAAAAGAGDPAQLLRYTRADIGIAMSIAGLVNLSMLAIAAKLFHQGPGTPAIALQAVHSRLAETVGGSVALAFAAALLASGISSSSVGTAAGQIIMDGFLRLHIPVWLRRAVTMSPAVILLVCGADPTKALVLSQVTLSFGIPFALGALLWLTSRRDIMGPYVNTTATKAGMAIVVAVLGGLNILLLAQQSLSWLGF
ncbi:Nramp family divalent metal transporter [Actinoplanes sp. TFC3]|uniref:Nramp family divalent metal transporter n=1 Tax=Actinoplanes sp. TFC3 TaxID=1710355 RepID=UPI000AED4968|nr:Nramp family divalent metal transporter [Actinoplanes sp. TFC3]